MSVRVYIRFLLRLSMWSALLLCAAHCDYQSAVRSDSGQVRLHSEADPINLAATADYVIVDPALSIQDIQSDDLLWVRDEQSTIDLKYNSHVYWLRIALVGGGPQADRVVTLPENRLDAVDFYLLQPDGIQSDFTGQLNGQRSDLAAYPAFAFHLPAGKAADLFIRIQSPTALSFPVYLYSAPEFAWERKLVLIAHLSLILLLPAFLFYQFRLRPGSHGMQDVYLTLAIVCGSAFIFCFYGEAQRWLWPEQVWLREHLDLIFLCLFVMSYILYMHGFVPHRQSPLALHLSVYAFVSVCIIMLAYLIREPVEQNRLNGMAFVLIGMHLVLIPEIALLYRRSARTVGYLFVAWLSLAAGSAALITDFLHCLSYGLFTRYTWPLTFVSAMVLSVYAQYVSRRAMNSESGR
ncbi:MAG: hypothetical protein KDK34_12045 [Leptospiraceae bacterium]|nr:hypothetical protein [Leptospiraceae bacterium]